MNYYPAILLFLLASPCSSQVLTNNGAVIGISSGTFMSADLENNSGSITNLGTAALGNVTAQSGSTFTNNSLLTISGTMGGTGNIISTNAAVEINGTAAQTIPANFFYNNTIQNLTTNNSAGILLSGALNIKNTLLASSGTFNANGYLTLLSDSIGTALIDGSAAGGVSGTVIMQRYLPSGYGYRYLSSPFQAATVAELANDVNLASSFPSVYRYDENLLSAGWVNYTSSSGTLNPLQGYAVNCGSSTSAKTIDISGTVNNGTVSASLYNRNRTYTLGFNLVGNPYPSPIDWNAATGWTRTNIDNALYYFNPGATDQYTGTYTTYINGVSSDGIANNIIPAMQAFFVHVSNGSYPVSGTLSVNNAARVNNLNPVFHKGLGSGDVPLVRLSAKFEGDSMGTDYAAIYFDESATPSFEDGIDALKLNNTDDRIPNLYMVSSDAQRLSISGIPDPSENSSAIPLGIMIQRDGWLDLKAPVTDNIPSGTHIFLADAGTNAITDLQQISNYRIFLSKGSYENRFYLIFSKSEKVSVPGMGEELQAYSSGNSVFVDLPAESGELQITNAIGQIISSEILSGKGYHEVKLNAAPGVYLVTLNTSTNRRSKKLVVSN